MSVIIVTGAGGLIGSEAVRRFVRDGYDVIGIDNDLRRRFFGSGASTAWMIGRLAFDLPGRFTHRDIDIRDRDGIDRVFAGVGRDLTAVVHCAAQPSHDWAAKDPFEDFGVNALGTLTLLEATRQWARDAAFLFCSTNKVYGDTPNALPLAVVGDRLDLPEGHPYHAGIDTTMSIDQTKHSVFGASKVAADVMVQEYGRYFGMNTLCLRGGCLTGPAHSGAKLHGFLSYLVRCAVTGTPYEVLGYGGLQVRDNIHSADFVAAMATYLRRPRPGAVFNLGGGRANSCSIREAVALVQSIAGVRMEVTVSDAARSGDHRWWITDNGPFQAAYPEWGITIPLERTVREIVGAMRGRA